MERKEALDKLLPMQQEDYEKIFEVMQGHPITIRLLDPPLHEFLPDKEELLVDVTRLSCTDPDAEELQTKKTCCGKSAFWRNPTRCSATAAAVSA